MKAAAAVLLALTASLRSHVADAALRDSSELTNNCYGFPEMNYDRVNCIKCTYGTSPKILVNTGDNAIDFTLHSVDGVAWTLSEKLAEGKPAVIIWGMFTCPAFEGMGTDSPFESCAYWHEAALVAAYSDRVNFAHLVAAEPHPLTPDTNFDSGTVRPNYWSVVRQARDYPSRVAMTRRIAPLIHPASALLPDYLPDNPYSPGASQPVWCSYTQGARSATLIGTDGVVVLAQDWFNSLDMATAIETLLAEGGTATKK